MYALHGLAVRAIQCKVLFSSWFAKEPNVVIVTTMTSLLLLLPPPGVHYSPTRPNQKTTGTLLRWEEPGR